MSEILFIRHAETDMVGTFCGQSDPELNMRGRGQLAELVSKLRTEDIGAVYASDLRRAHTTGIAVAEAFGVDCHVRSALREIGFGDWEGLTWEEIERRDEAYARRWVAEYPSLPAPNGETFRDFERRVLEEVKLLSMEVETGGSIAVVTHAGVIRVVLCALDDCSEKDVWERTRAHCCIVRHTGAASPSLRRVEVRS